MPTLATFRVDAKLLAQFAALIESTPTAQKSDLLQSLGELMNARQSLVADRTGLKNRSHVQRAKLLVHCKRCLGPTVRNRVGIVDVVAERGFDI